MHKVILIAYCAVSLSSVCSEQTQNITEDKDINKNVTLLKSIAEKNSLKNWNKNNETKENDRINSSVHVKHNKIEKVHNASQHQMNNYSNEEAEKSYELLQRIRARIARSKDAVWAAITLTFMCIILLLAVAQSRMWKDNHYSEAQGIPLPNFNERHLFKDVMEHKMATLKKFFKKKVKEKDATELESLLPPSEWDN